jgi:hypothetical protein
MDKRRTGRPKPQVRKPRFEVTTATLEKPPSSSTKGANVGTYWVVRDRRTGRIVGERSRDQAYAKQQADRLNADVP